MTSSMKESDAPASSPANPSPASSSPDGPSEPSDLPPRLARIVDRFRRSPREIRVQALLQFGRKLPPLPEELATDRSALEKVHECQTPFFLASRVDADGCVHLFFDAPPESPTVRGFAGILREGLEGETWQEVLRVPADFYGVMRLEEVVSPLRLRGMGAILARLQRQVREACADLGGPSSGGASSGDAGSGDAGVRRASGAPAEGDPSTSASPPG